MDLHITLGERGDLTAQIYRQLLEAVIDGRLRAGERLPASRELARQLSVSRNTVSVAYDRLSAEGYLTGRVGAGTYVSAIATAPRTRRAPGDARMSGVRPRRVWPTVPGVEQPATPPWYDFSVGVPDKWLFPYQTWRRLVKQEWRPTAMETVDYGEPAGQPALRAAIARHVGVSRAVRAGPDDVLVTNGAQQALDIIGRVLIEPGATVAVEEPGYPPVRFLYASLGARVVGVPVDEDGLVVDALPRSARLVYVTPSHQFPYGVPMSLARRAALLAWAERHDAVVIEDDYDSEFRYSDRPLEPLQSIDRSGRVVYVGTFSKTMLPVLRLGFLVTPPALRSALRTAKMLTDWNTDPVTQATMARFIDEGLLSRHIRRATRLYAIRHDKVVAWVRGQDRLDLVPSTAGLHVCARVRPGVRLPIEAVRQRAARAGIAIRTLTEYCHDGEPQAGLVIGYGAIATDRIDDGLVALTGTLR